MRDFGFWVRLIAISQLFSLVLVNYGHGWLSEDSSVVNLVKGTPNIPQDEPPASAAPKARRPVDQVGAGTWQDQYTAGWGGIEAPEMKPAAPDLPEFVRNGSLEADTSTWASEER